MGCEELIIEGRDAVLKVFRSDRATDKLPVLDDRQDGPVRTILREAGKHDTIINYVSRERLDQISGTGKHQNVIVYAVTYECAEVGDILKAAEEKGESFFLILLDDIEDPHDLGAIIRTVDLVGAHGIIIPKHHAAGLTATVVKTSARALSYTSVAKATNLTTIMEDLKKKGMWFVRADMDRKLMYKMNPRSPTELVVGNEGEGIGKLMREHRDMVASIPMKGDIDSLGVLVAAGVLAYKIVRQRLEMQFFQR